MPTTPAARAERWRQMARTHTAVNAGTWTRTGVRGCRGAAAQAAQRLLAVASCRGNGAICQQVYDTAKLSRFPVSA
jgi:hypothetical protein